MARINLQPTLDFQEAIERGIERSDSRVTEVAKLAQDLVREHGMVFEAKRELQVGLSPLVLSNDDYESIRVMTERLHLVVERALDWLVDSPARLEHYFPDHRRFFTYLRKIRGSKDWQVVARYDAIVDGAGHLRIIELNTACPAGFFHSHGMAEITRQLLRHLVSSESERIPGSGAIGPDALVNALLQVEADSGLAPSLIALVNDENRLFNELGLLADEFGRRGRKGGDCASLGNRMR